MAATATGVEEAKRTSLTGPRRASAPAGRSFFRLNRRTSERLVLIGFLVPALTYVVLFFAYPLYQDISISLQDYGFSALASGHGTFVGFANYRAMLSNSATIRALVNTLIFTVASVVLQFSIGFAMALYLNKQFSGSGFLRRFILVPWVIPFVVTGTIFSLIFATSNGLANQILEALGLIHSPIGWLTNGYLALTAIIIANIWAGVPFNAVLLYSGLQDVPAEQLEAAAVDGANRLAALPPGHRTVYAPGDIDRAHARGRLHGQGVRPAVGPDRRRAGQREPAHVDMGVHPGFYYFQLRDGDGSGQHTSVVHVPGRYRLHIYQ